MNEILHFKNRTNFILIWLSIFILVFESSLNAQLARKVLFLGNSYTGVNNLPQLVHDVALSASDTLVFDSYIPGGYQLISHSIDNTSQNKIMAGGWNYVVLQGQSQEAITNNSGFSSGGYQLNNLISQYNPCAVTMLYMTWGRKNGDTSNCANFPVMCTYEGMDSTIRNNYLKLAKNLYAEVSPVSVVWNYLRQNFPSINLYQADESHPSAEGSYAAACCFYTTIFKRDPTLITFDFGLNATVASNIRDAVKAKVFDHLNLWDFKKLPESNFSYNIGSGVNEVNFIPKTNGTAETYLWDFGDGVTSSAANVTHSFLSNGTYTVSLTTTNCDLQGLHTSFTDTIIQFCNHTPIINTLHPWLCQNDTLWTQSADSYQWYLYGQPLPETNQYLSMYYQYSIGSGFSVLSTINGCSELSQEYNQTPLWSGYYFDLLGNPCVGDTVRFAVLHINGFLSGLENIFWLKNDTLLTSKTNEDTLLITSAGKYECKVIDPTSNCLLDTTSYLIEYNCAAVGIKENKKELIWSIYPNPASEAITIKISNNQKEEQVQIYNAVGQLIKTKEVIETTEINVADLPNGVYFVLLKSNKHHPFKFIKL